MVKSRALKSICIAIIICVVFNFISFADSKILTTQNLNAVVKVSSKEIQYNRVQNTNMLAASFEAPLIKMATSMKNNEISLIMSEELRGTQGDPEAFTVSGATSKPIVTEVDILSVFVTLKLDKPIASGEEITLSY